MLLLRWNCYSQLLYWFLYLMWCLSFDTHPSLGVQIDWRHLSQETWVQPRPSLPAIRITRSFKETRNVSRTVHINQKVKAARLVLDICIRRPLGATEWWSGRWNCHKTSESCKPFRCYDSYENHTACNVNVINKAFLPLFLGDSQATCYGCAQGGGEEKRDELRGRETNKKG